MSALASLRTAMENTLGMAFQGPEGEHFFRSILVQTLFYGVFAAWVLWHKENPARSGRFDWRLASYYLNVPVIQALFEKVSAHSKLKALGLIEPLDWAGATLNRVDRAAFFAKFDENTPSSISTSRSCEAYDPELRKQLGIWYTPPEIIRYMVARVDAVLRGELGVADGLADPDVVHPGSVLRHRRFSGGDAGAHRRDVVAKARKALLAAQTQAGGHATRLRLRDPARVAGVAHMQIGLALSRWGAPLAEDQRAGVYLTNALIGWEPPDAHKEKALEQLLIPSRNWRTNGRGPRGQARRQNPGGAGQPALQQLRRRQPPEEGGLVEPYKVGLNTEWGIKKFNLDDLYIRFFRLAERRIAEMTGKGVVCVERQNWPVSAVSG